MKFLEVIGILQLSPLFRRFRERVEAKDVQLEESVKTLAYESELVLMKLRWLLPATRLESDQEEEAGEIIPAAEDLLAAGSTLAMEPWEVGKAVDIVQEHMSGASQSFARGRVPEYEGGRRLTVVNISPEDILKALLVTERRSPSGHRVLTVPRFSFVTHLRDFWREVRRLTAKGAVLRFSRFLGQSRQEAILNFLAFLELIKRRRLYARQRELLGDIEFSTTQDNVNREGDTEP